jgi:hypothetical protein
VETRDVNKAVKNNPDKFPPGYVIELEKSELENLRWKFSTANFSMIRTLPKAFTEKGLYMLATILKSKQAVQTTLAIIETFTKIRTIGRNIRQLTQIQDEQEKKTVLQQSGQLVAEILEEDLRTTEKELEIELNLAVLKFRHTIKTIEKKKPKK